MSSSVVYALLRTGHASGAEARWRTLHEIAVTSILIAENGDDLARRYIKHDMVKAWEGAEECQRHCHTLGYESFTPEELTRIREDFDAVSKEYGEVYKGGYGWASEVLRAKKPTLKGRSISFGELEDAVSMSHMRPYYRMASHSVHPTSKGTKFNIGVIEQQKVLLWSNEHGFLRPWA